MECSSLFVCCETCSCHLRYIFYAVLFLKLFAFGFFMFSLISEQLTHFETNQTNAKYVQWVEVFERSIFFPPRVIYKVNSLEYMFQ